MERREYLECNQCNWLVYTNRGDTKCPQCKQGTLHSVTELEGKALDGDHVFRLDTELALALNAFVGKDVVITIRER
jgi:hypothetical protein